MLQAAQFVNEGPPVLTAMTVTVQVLQGQDLVAINKGWTYSSSDPRVVVQVVTGGNKRPRAIDVGKTKVVKDTLNPIWGGTSNVFQATLKEKDLGMKQSKDDDEEEEPLQLVLKLSIYDGEKDDKDHLMGIVTIDLNPQKAMDQWGEWFDIPASSAKHATGRLQLSLQSKLYFSNDKVDEPSSGRKLGSSVASVLRASATAFDLAKDAPVISLDSATTHTTTTTTEVRPAAPPHTSSHGSSGLRKVMATPGKTLKKTLSMANMAGMAAIHTLSFDDQDVAAAAPKAAAPKLTRSMSSSALQQPPASFEKPSSRHGKFATKNYVASTFRSASKDAAALLATPKRAATKSLKATRGMMKGLMDLALDDTQHAETTKPGEGKLDKESSEQDAAGAPATKPLSSSDTKPSADSLFQNGTFRKAQSKDMAAFCTPKRTTSKTLKVKKSKGIMPGGLALDETQASDKVATTEAKPQAEKPESKPPKEAPSRIHRSRDRSKDMAAFCTPKRTTSKTLKVKKAKGSMPGLDGLALDGAQPSEEVATTEAKPLEADPEKGPQQSPETKPPKEAPARIHRSRSKARSKDRIASGTPKRTTSKTLKVETKGSMPGLGLDDTQPFDKLTATEAKEAELKEGDPKKDGGHDAAETAGEPSSRLSNPLSSFDTKPPPSRIDKFKAHSSHMSKHMETFCTPKRSTSKTLKIPAKGSMPGLDGLGLEGDVQPHPDGAATVDAKERKQTKKSSSSTSSSKASSRAHKSRSRKSPSSATASPAANSRSSKSSRGSKSKQLRKPKPAPDVTKVSLSSETKEKKELPVSGDANRCSPLTLDTTSSSDDFDKDNEELLRMEQNDPTRSMEQNDPTRSSSAPSHAPQPTTTIVEGMALLTKASSSPSSSPPASTTPADKTTWTCCCGQEVDNSGKFCGMCGTKRLWTCSGCAFENNGCRFRFCGMCGTDRDAAAPNTTGSSNNQNAVSCR